MNIKHFLKNNFFTKPLYKFLQNIKQKKINKKKNTLMKKNGLATLKSLQAFFDSQDKAFFFDMGTLLGAIREGDFIGHDLDIDVAVFLNNEEEKKNMIKEMENSGSVEKFRFTFNNKIIESSFVLNGVKYDLNFYEKLEEKDVCYLMYRDPSLTYGSEEFDVVQLTCSPIGEIKKFNFKDVLINVPNDCEKYLSERYGQNWRIKDKNYIYWKGPSTSKVEGKGYRVVINERA